MRYSIITVNYNNKGGLEKTIKSVISQTFRDFEYIIIDGGSTDGSVDIIRKYADEITYWVSELDKGIYNAMNKGVMKAQGDYLNFMNSGDCFHDVNVLSEVLKKSNGESIITGRYADASTSSVYQVIAPSITLLTLLKEPFNHQATFYKRELFGNRQYDESLHIQADWKFNMQSIIMDNCSVKIVDTIVADYDFNGISIKNSKLTQEERKKVLRELYPVRILMDYEKMYTDEEVPLLTLVPQLKNSYLLQRIVFHFTMLLLKLRSILKRK